MDKYSDKANIELSLDQLISSRITPITSKGLFTRSSKMKEGPDISFRQKKKQLKYRSASVFIQPQKLYNLNDETINLNQNQLGVKQLYIQ